MRGPRCTTFEALFAGEGVSARLSSVLASSPGRSPLAVHGLSKAVALTGEDHNVRVVDQPVDEGRSQAVVAENGVPLAELQIGSNDKAAALIAV